MTRKLLCIVALAVCQVAGQDVGPVRGETAGDYNIVQSWEFGYRFAAVGGSRAEYRADVNYGNGIRLLDSNLSVHSKDGKGHFFDEIVLTTQGLGNDPYESVVLRAQKNRIFEYDFTWRKNDYYNPGLLVAGSFDAENTTHRWQDHDLTIFPQSKAKIRLGYSRNGDSGPALTSQQFFDTQSNALPLFSKVHRQFDEYRLGGEVEAAKVKLTVLRRWEFYKEDTPISLPSSESTNDPNNPAILQSFAKSEPQRGYTPGWLVNLFTERKLFSLNGRFTYSGGQQNFVLNESAVGMDRFGANQNRFVQVSGNARRPVTAADGLANLFLTKKITLVNNSSFTNTRIAGNNFYEQFDLSTLSDQVLNFQFLGIRLFTNSTDLRYQLSPRLGIYTGYEYSDRSVQSNESVATPGSPYDAIMARQSNHQHVGSVGVNWVIFKALRLHAEGELGRNDTPFYPTSLKDYHALSGRLQYRVKKVQLSANYKETYNNNSITLTAYSSRARNLTANGTWTLANWFGIDASYSHLHLDTLGGIAFFAGAPRASLVTGDQSVYVSSIHAANLSFHFAVGKRADLYMGYGLTRDVGDGRTNNALPSDPTTGLLYSVQTFPLVFQSPAVRVSVRLHQKLRFNMGYQYYGYKEDFGQLSTNENYRASTGFTSLLWSF